MHTKRFSQRLLVPLLALATIALAAAARPGGGILERPVPTRDSLPGDILVGLGLPEALGSSAHVRR